MADFTNTNDLIDVRDIIARVEELREQRTERWVAGWNMPGYMPDTEPAEFDNAEDAKQYIIDSVKRAEDETEDETEAETLCGFAEDVNLETADEFSAQCLQYVYWVREDGVMGLDDDETEELETLESLLEEIKGYGGDEQWEGDWYPVTLIRYSHFEDYAKELAEECGMVNADAKWPNNCIDWEKAARELQWDYSTVDYDDVTYWYR